LKPNNNESSNINETVFAGFFQMKKILEEIGIIIEVRLKNNSETRMKITLAGN
jgi:hypothetical protein